MLPKSEGIPNAKYQFVPGHGITHLRKPRVLSPLRSLRVRNEVDLVPLACEDGNNQSNELLDEMSFGRNDY